MTVVSQQPPPRASLSLWGWLCLLAKVGRIVAGLIAKSIGYLLSSSPKNASASKESDRTTRSFHHFIAYKGMIDFQGGLSSAEKQAVLPSTSFVCRHFAHQHNLPYAEVQLPDGTLACLLNGSSSSKKFGSRFNPFSRKKSRTALNEEMQIAKQKATKVIVYFHGGGYAVSMLPQHLHEVYGFEDKPCWQEGVIVYVLSYSLASEHANHYPTQLRQAISLLDHILNTENVSPSCITLMGNSAGSNLLLGLLLHLSHPNPDLPAIKLKDNGRLAAAVAVSPWCTMDVSAASMTENADKDVLAPSAIAYWGQNFLGSCVADPWNSPLIAPSDWWADHKANELLLFYGEDEILRDDTATLCDKIKAADPTRTTVYRLQGEGHEQMAMNKLLFLPGHCESEKIFTAWMKERFL